MSSTVEDLERKVQSLQDQLQAAKDSLYTARCAHYGFTADSVFTYGGHEYKFAKAVFYDSKSKPWVVGFPRLKSGRWSENTKNLYAEWRSDAVAIAGA